MPDSGTGITTAAATPVVGEDGTVTTVTSTGCEPGPDAEDEKLLTETDRTPL